MKKLVRDKIPEIIESRGEKADYYIADDGEYIKSLKDKLFEEGKELSEAVGMQKIINELADVLEVVDAIIEYNKINPEDVFMKKNKKKEERGGFEKKYILNM